MFLSPDPSPDRSWTVSQPSFVLFSALSGVGAGSVPAMHHLAMGLQQARAIDRGRLSDREVNRLVHALGVLQTVGQTIAGVRCFFSTDGVVDRVVTCSRCCLG